jgi:multicomponent Na+:H+ antiporter subunit D
MFQLYQRVFLADKPGDPWQSKTTSSRRPRVLVVLLAALVLAMGLWPEPLLVLSEQAAASLTGSPGGGSP